MKLRITTAFFLIASFLFGQNGDLSKKVNPFIGTGGHGHTYPGAARPFGMVQLSPDTRLDGWDGCGGYHYDDSILYGFSHTHLSGTGISDYGDLLLLPHTVSAKGKTTYNLASKFSHKNEEAHAGYYKVLLESYDIQAELTSTVRTGYHRYSFPKGKQQFVTLDLKHRDKLISGEYTIINNTTIVGHRVSKAWASEQHFYFVVEFSAPFTVIDAQKGKIFPITGDPIEKNLATTLQFDTKGKPLVVRVGASFTSIDGAKKNLAAEQKGFDFDAVRLSAEQDWNSELSKVEIKDENETNKTIYYSALYHSFLNPNTFSDVDGTYRGMDGKMHKTENGRVQYSVFSLWDTFRATHPLFSILQRKRTSDIIHTFLNQYQQGGKLPVWELAGNETECMIGFHSVPVILDAWVAGIRDFDAEMALKAMMHSAELDAFGLKSFNVNGCVLADDESESVSRTLEYAYDCWCIARFAELNGKADIAKTYYAKAEGWKQLFDPFTGFFRARTNGGWYTPFDPFEVNFHFTEANAWQYSMFVPHMPFEFANRFPTRPAKGELLDNGMYFHLHKLFTVESQTSGREQADITGLIGQYAHGNEPSHHMAYFFNFTNHIQEGQAILRKIQTELYKNAPDGLAGNEDCGQMSSWFNFSALGFYPFCPGSGYYTLGSPLFKEVILHTEEGKSFTISTNNIPQNGTVNSATLNNQNLSMPKFDVQALLNGGSLSFDGAPSMSKNAWKIYSLQALSDTNTLIAPIFNAPSMSFKDSMQISIYSGSPQTQLVYRISGGSWITPGSGKINLTLLQNTNIETYSIFQGKKSPISSASYYKLDPLRKLNLKSEYGKMYTGGGNNALIDGLRGGNSFIAGKWQGFQGDIDGDIDLGKSTKATRIGISCLQDVGAWIALPSKFEVEVSEDGVNWTKLEAGASKTDLKKDDKIKQTIWVTANGKSIRYIRFKAVSYGKLPEWHIGAGGQTWIFADEIIVE